jgi:glycosyltransferase involved in cell wall biosynthesis
VEISNDRRGDAPAQCPPRSAYVIVTPARDEVDVIERTIDAIRAQTLAPRRWVIVDDGSVDGTGDLVARRVRDLADTVLVRRRAGPIGDFASKVHAFGEGVDALAGVDHEYLCNLDADVTVGPDYFERLLEEFARRPRLGIAGGLVAVVDDQGREHRRRTTGDTVAGAVQCFRRTCYDEIGGILPLPRGGEDAAAQILARSLGWQVATIPELSVRHDGPVLNRHRSSTAAYYSRGIVNRGLGYDPLFQVGVSLFRMRDRPYVVGGVAMLAGYLGAMITRQPLVLPPSAVAFLRREQRARLRRLVTRG